MILKLKESIMCAGVHYLPPAEVDTEVLCITDEQALVLVRRGTAELVEPVAAAAEAEAEAEAAPAPRARRKKD